MESTINEKLFIVENRPLKFYLDGFDVQAFLKIAATIKKYGGMVTIPDYETIVLSVPNRIPGTQFITFHVDWLDDTIKRNERQDLGKYLMPLTTEYTKEQIPQDTAGTTDNNDDNDKLSELTAELLQQDESHVSSISANTDMKQNMQNGMAKQDMKRSRPKVYKPKKRSVKNVKRMPLEEKIEQHTNEADESISSNVRRRGRWSNHEDMKLLEYLIDNNLITESRNFNVWERMTKAEIFGQNRSAFSLRRRFHNTIIPNIRKYTDDPKILQKLEVLENKKRRRKSSC